MFLYRYMCNYCKFRNVIICETRAKSKIQCFIFCTFLWLYTFKAKRKLSDRLKHCNIYLVLLILFSDTFVLNFLTSKIMYSETHGNSGTDPRTTNIHDAYFRWSINNVY